MTEDFEDPKVARRYESLAKRTNRFYAYAVVYGDMSGEDAREFAAWVRHENLTTSQPSDTLDRYFGVDLN